MNTKEEVLNKCTVEGLIVKLPSVQLDRKLYMEVAKSLELIGGKWKGGKVQGFVFQQDPTDLISEIANGGKRNLKKEFQFFPTPDDIADWLVKLAEIEDGQCVLEPSAGQGAIIDAIYRAFPQYMKGPNDKTCVSVDYYELMDVNRIILSKKINSHESYSSRTSEMGVDFMEGYISERYKRIVANPPFAKNQDIEHIMRMYDLLQTTGRLVSVASKHWQLSKNKKETEFRQWLDKLGATIKPIEGGQFKESGTMIETCVIVLTKK